jgi:hypothetical protein
MYNELNQRRKQKTYVEIVPRLFRVRWPLLSGLFFDFVSLSH